MNRPLPPRGDREAARQWLRERALIAPAEQLPTHAGLLRDQLDRLLAQAGFPPVQERSGAVRLDVALDGSAVIDHSASISLLGLFFTSFQNTVTAVAQALEGTPTAAGQIPGYISAATQLRSIAAFPSSYGLRLQGPDVLAPEWEQSILPFPSDAEISPHQGSTSGLLPETVRALLDITDLAQIQEGNESQELLLEKLVPLGQRALGHLATLAGTLAAHDASLKMTWQPDTDQARTGSISTEAAVRLKDLSEGVRFSDPDQRLLEGELIEASLRRGAVVIELDSGVMVNARTESGVTPRLRENLLGKRVAATVQTTIAQYAGGRQREFYVVTDIHPADH